jgi:outer membrane protein OmpA-like peptidoglycan-associated protein
MRKISLLGFALILFVSQLYAQPSRPISERNYWGLEAGTNYGWLGGAKNFYFIYSDPYADPGFTYLLPQPFESLGGGIGFNLGATLDLSLSKLLGLQGRIFYQTHNVGTTEIITVDNVYFNGPNGTGAGAVTLEDDYTMNLSYFGGSVAARLQLIPESWYGKIGFAYGANTGADFKGYQKIVASDVGFRYIHYPSGAQVGSPGDTIVTIAGDMSNSMAARTSIDLGIGTFIKLGNADWVLTPELTFSIPLSNLYKKNEQDIYRSGNVLLGDPDGSIAGQPYVIGIPVTTPSLWNIALTVGIKFPWGSNASRKLRSDEKETVLAGHVRDRKTKDALDDAEVTIIDLSTNEEVDKQSTDESGSYGIVLYPGRYSVTAEADGYLFNSTYFEVNEAGQIIKGNPDIYLEKPPAKVRLLVFFDFNKSELKEESNPELVRAVKLLKKNSTMEVEIAGHTDNVGSDQYNKELSQRRANAVLEYLTQHGITTSRLTAIGYGEAQPIDSNDTEDGRATNRRVEFIVKRM